MSNRIDFFQSEQKSLSLPAASLSIFLDGVLCPYLELLEIVHKDWPGFSHALLSYNPAGFSATDDLSLEEIENLLPIGKTVSIHQFYNPNALASTADSLPVFAGKIENLETRLDKNDQVVEIEVSDYSKALERITIFGKRVSDNNNTVFLSGLDTIFNENAKPNASAQPLTNEGKTYRMFSVDSTSSIRWSYAEVIDYLLDEYLPDEQLETPSLELLEILTDGQIVSELDVIGLNLLQALQKICRRTSLEFRFEAYGSGQRIVFYKQGYSNLVELNAQPNGQKISVSKTDVAKLNSKKHLPVTHRYIGQGDFKTFEATFDLVKAWDSNDETTNYDDFSPLTNPDFYKVKNVYRKWVLNEAGVYTNSPYNQGSAFDFSKIFGTANFVHRPRRFYPALTTDNQDNSLGYFFQVSYDNGTTWRQYLFAFDILLDECGVWLSCDQLDVDTWIGLLKGTLKFRITASVASDERLSCEMADGPVNSVIPVVDHIMTLPSQFKYRKISEQSIFYNSTDSSLGQPDETDDSTLLYEYVRKRAGTGSEIIETVDLQTLYPVLYCWPGDRITASPDSRDLLGLKTDNRSTSYIKHVHIDFKNQCTNLKIIRKRDAML